MSETMYIPHLIHATIYNMFENNAEIGMCNKPWHATMSQYLYIQQLSTTMVDLNQWKLERDNQPTNFGIHELSLREPQVTPTRQDTSLDEDDLGISTDQAFDLPFVEPGLELFGLWAGREDEELPSPQHWHRRSTCLVKPSFERNCEVLIQRMYYDVPISNKYV